MKIYIMFKMLLDYTFSIILLLFLSPIIIVCAIAIKLEDPSGPILFKQSRVGKNNQVFKIMKLRSMKVVLEKEGLKLTDSDRLLITGRFIRKLSFDELPQLFNILKGEMSFIGPRPLPIVYLPYYNDREIHRHDVKPGISGLAQVSGRNNLNWDEKFAKDLEYVNNISIFIDFKILLLTLFKVFVSSDVAVRGENFIVDFNEYRIKQNQKSIEENED